MGSLQRKDQLFMLTLNWKKCFFLIFSTEKWAITVYPRREKVQLVFPGQEKLEVVQRSNGKRPFYPAKNQQKAIFVSPYMGLNQIQTTHVALWIRLQTSESNELPTTLKYILITGGHGGPEGGSPLETPHPLKNAFDYHLKTPSSYNPPQNLMKFWAHPPPGI